jgi:hypothetical protein
LNLFHRNHRLEVMISRSTSDHPMTRLEID